MAENEKKNTVNPQPVKNEPVKAVLPKTNAADISEKLAARASDTVDSEARFSVPLSFDLSEILALLSSIRDGDYYTAVQRAVRILNSVLNPKDEVRRVGATGPLNVSLSGDDAAAYRRAAEMLRKEVESLESGEEEEKIQPVNLRTGQPKLAFNFANAIAIFKLVLDLIEQFKNKG